MTAMARAKPELSQGWARRKPEVHLGLPSECSGPRTCAIFGCFPNILTGSCFGNGAAAT